MVQAIGMGMLLAVFANMISSIMPFTQVALEMEPVYIDEFKLGGEVFE